jgi:F-type H+-transporting ATPase subunit delta
MSNTQADESNAQSNVFDDESMHVGQIYAKAFLGAAEASKSVDNAVTHFESFVEVLDKQPAFESALANPKLPAEDKIRMLDKVFASKLDGTLLKFLKVIAVRRRFGAIRSIFQSVMNLRDEAVGRLRVIVTTAQPLDESSVKSLTEKLKGIFKKDVVLTAKVDPSVLGGLLIRVGDVVFDGSVDGQLKQLKSATSAKTEQVIRDKLSSLAS